MKAVRVISFLCVISSFWSCNQDEEALLTAQEGQLAARINGNVWASFDVVVDRDDDKMVLVAVGGKGDCIAIQFMQTSKGSFAFENLTQTNAPNHIITYTPVSDASFTSNHPNSQVGGDMNISAIDEASKVISGTYDVTLARTIEGEDSIITVLQATFNKVKLKELTTTIGDNTFMAKVNDVVFAPSEILASRAVGKISISCKNEVGQIINLSFPNDIEPGTYEIGNLANVASFRMSDKSIFNSVDGSLIITNHNTETGEIEGSFQFDGASGLTPNSKTFITGGQFALKY